MLQSLWGNLRQQFNQPLWLIWMAVAGVVIACAIAGRFLALMIGTLTDPPRRAVDSESWKCLPVPASFSAADLVGTWQASNKVLDQFEILQLLADGTYQQKFVDYPQNYYYEGQWNEWEVEFRPNGGIYLHLSGWKYCMVEKACGVNSSDEEPHGATGFFEFCEGYDFHPGSSMVLAVAGYTPRSGLPRPPREIVLIHPRILGTESSPAIYALLDEPGK